MFKQFKDLRSHAKQLQSSLAQESITIENKGVKITLNGNQELISIEIDKNYLSDKKENLEEAIKHTFNHGLKKIQKMMAQKMMKDGGLKNLGLPF